MAINKMLSIVVKTFENVMKYILIFSSILLVATLTTTVVMRYILKIDIFGLEELIIIPGFWLYFLGAAYASRIKNYHIQADLISSYMTSEIGLKIIQLITSLVTCVTAVIMTYWSFEFFQNSLLSGSKTPALKIPLYVSHSSVFFGFLIMTLYFIMHLINDVIALRNWKRGGGIET